MKSPPKQKVTVYIDGFNLYFGMKDVGLNRCYWLDVTALSNNLLKPNQVLIYTKYFTARISGPPPKRKRQTTYLDALNTLENFKMYEGHYRSKNMHCRECGARWPIPEEKMTDVNIATEILVDAFNDRYDTALLISGDSDLVPPIRSVKNLFPQKRIVVAFPPKRGSKHLRQVASACVHIKKPTLLKSQLPESITLPSGQVLRRPDQWQ